VIEADNRPIIFQASVLPASDPSLADFDKPSGSLSPPPAKKGTVPFSIRYTVPMDALTVKDVDGKHQIVFGVAAIVLNRYGTLVQRDAHRVTMVLKETAFQRSPHLPIVLDEQLNLAKDDQYLNLGVWDPVTGRAGSIQVPVEISKSTKH
jgi:hypothetical protein